MDDLIGIGRFARLSGLSIGALRHYDDVDLLRPAEVDAFTSYRRYHRSQLDTARTIARLRDLELPLEEIRAVLAADDPDDRRRLLDEHRRRIEARTYRLQRVLHHVAQLAQGKETAMSTPPGPPDLDDAARRALAVGLFNPEAAAGPHDSAYLFDRFVELMATAQPVNVPASVLAELGEKETI